MKKVILSIIYPFWVFFKATLVGNVFLLFMAGSPVPILVRVLTPDVMATTGPKAESIAMGMAIFTILSLPFTIGVLMYISSRLKGNYEKWGYKTFD